MNADGSGGLGGNKSSFLMPLAKNKEILCLSSETLFLLTKSK